MKYVLIYLFTFYAGNPLISQSKNDFVQELNIVQKLIRQNVTYNLDVIHNKDTATSVSLFLVHKEHNHKTTTQFISSNKILESEFKVINQNKFLVNWSRIDSCFDDVVLVQQIIYKKAKKTAELNSFELDIVKFYELIYLLRRKKIILLPPLVEYSILPE